MKQGDYRMGCGREIGAWYWMAFQKRYSWALVPHLVFVKDAPKQGLD